MFLKCTEKEIKRWNTEWLRYLSKGFEFQLLHYSAYPNNPPLPDDPLDLLSLELGCGPPLSFYCDRDRIEDKNLMEIGCGCGNLGKLIARYCKSYLGTDYSTLSLAIAQLVSPKNCTYIHLSSYDHLRSYFSSIDTVLSRAFWIHQNLDLARKVLMFIEMFLKTSGRIYADFYWPNPQKKQGKVFSPYEPLSEQFPSATFSYSSEDISELIKGMPFRIIRNIICLEKQRRYVVFEKVVSREDHINDIVE